MTSQAAPDAPTAARSPQTAAVRITEIFLSVQGEGLSSGVPTVFVRLTGCPLRCRYCDTVYAFHGGQRMRIAQVLAAVAQHGVRHVCVTGGEPLAQRACLPLLTALCDAGHAVSLETSGALDVAAVDARVIKVLDLKAPGSGEVARNRYENLAWLQPADQVKLVLRDRADYEWARAQIAAHRLAERCTVLLSPSWGELDPRQLAEWLLEDRLPARLQLQLHKYLWGEEPGR